MLDGPPRALNVAEQKISNAANDFSFALFRQINTAQKGVNVFTSPLSASMALGMTMNGAANATAEQMRSALALGSASDAEISEGYNSLITLLRGLDPKVDVRIANSIWYRDTIPVNQAFIDASRSSFGARITALDFGNPSAVTAINDWVSEATAAKITTIVDAIARDQVMLLINAIYFKGTWRDQFDPSQTRDGTFAGASGRRPAKLMHRNGTMRHVSTPTFDAVDLPYGNTAFTMTVALPRSGATVESIATSIELGSWATATSGFAEALVDLLLPRFKLEWERVLNGDLVALGMRDAFTQGGADFTRMSPRGRSFFINMMKQKTFVDVNEEGTEAAAVTSVGVAVDSTPQPIVFHVDRPFLFVIRERFSGTIVFMGKIVELP